jgi:hypothetical protein
MSRPQAPRGILAIASLLLWALVPRSARAQLAPLPADPAPAEWAVVAGATTALVPLAVGTSLLARENGPASPQAGIHVIDAGLALAPLVAHGLVGEWRRGLAFAAISGGAALGASIIVELRPDVIEHGRVAPRVSFAALLTLALFASGIGVADCAAAPERARRPVRFSVALVPQPGGVGLALGGTFR